MLKWQTIIILLVTSIGRFVENDRCTDEFKAILMCGLRHDRLYTFFGSYHTTSGVEGLSALLLVGPWVFDCVDAGHFLGAPLYNISRCFVFFNQGLCIGLKHFLLIVEDAHRVVHRDCCWCRGALLDRACALSQDGF